MPPNREMTLEDGGLRLWARTENRGRHMPIDRFFASIAEEHGSGAIGIVLSGTASDGTRGLNAIKEKGGITIAQDERTARYFSMPSSAISSGNVDLMLTPRANRGRTCPAYPGIRMSKQQAEPKPSKDGKAEDFSASARQNRSGLRPISSDDASATHSAAYDPESDEECRHSAGFCCKIIRP